jgi:hypothetical protein
MSKHAELVEGEQLSGDDLRAQLVALAQTNPEDAATILHLVAELQGVRSMPLVELINRLQQVKCCGPTWSPN